MSTLTLYKGNDCVLELLVREAIEDADMSGATVNYTLKDSDDTTVDTGSMSYVETETLDSITYYKFRATIADTVSITAGNEYTCEVDADGGPGLKGHWELSTQAETRTS
jgi:hypothetical protein